LVRIYAAAAKSALAGAGIALASGAVVVWQTAQVAVMFDLSFVLNNAYRMAVGDMPYRDFPMPYPPLTLFVQSLLIRLFGAHYVVHAAYAVIVDVVATALTYFIVLRVVGRPWAAGAICLPLVFLGIQDIYPHPLYDPDATLLMLAAIAIAVTIGRDDRLWKWAALGALIAMPVFAKQNTGAVFLAAMLVSISVTSVGRPRLVALFSGAAAVIVGGALVLQLTAGLDNVARWTIGLASARLAKSPPVLEWLADPAGFDLAGLVLLGLLLLARTSGRVGTVTGSVALAVPAALIVYQSRMAPGSILVLWPAVTMLALLWSISEIVRRNWSFATFLPLVWTVVATAAFLSQGVGGSSYALWPALALAVAGPVRGVLEWRVGAQAGARLALLATAAIVFVAAAAYTLSELRLDFIDLRGPVRSSAFPSLQGLSTHGDVLPELDDTLRAVSDLIPATEHMVVFPGEDPVYFALQRGPRFPIVQFDTSTNPYGPAELRALRDATGARWVLVKRTKQLRIPLPNMQEEIAALIDGFDLVAVAGGYEIYRRP
jgi:hypothetical protein